VGGREWLDDGTGAALKIMQRLSIVVNAKSTFVAGALAYDAPKVSKDWLNFGLIKWLTV
jgi:hypothetical protein